MESMDIEVLRTMTIWLDEGYKVGLGTVVKTWGSSPRPVGSMLGIRQDGVLIGSVSGGCVEDDLIERVCHGLLTSTLPQVMRYGITREESQRFGLPCGGTMQIVIEPLQNAENLKQILHLIEQGFVVSRHLQLITGDVKIMSVNPEQTLLFNGNELVTVHGPRWRLIIIGAGQVSRYLAEMALALDYQVTVCDPRDEYLQAWQVDNAPIVREMPDDLVKRMLPDRHTAIVCLSHDLKLDDMALLEALISDAFYVGAIGSKASTQKRRERMAMFDISEDEIGRLRGPIGLPIGSKTPPEIAISILAEMTAIKRHVISKLINIPNSTNLSLQTTQQVEYLPHH